MPNCLETLENDLQLIVSKILFKKVTRSTVDELQRAKVVETNDYWNLMNLNPMFNPTRVVLEGTIEDGSYPSQRGEAYVSLQNKSLHSGNAMELVSATKENLNNFRNNGCMGKVHSTDKQMHELAFRFNDEAIELLTLSSGLILKKDVEVLDTDQVCLLVEKYYPIDFTKQERFQLRYELEMFNIDGLKNPMLSGVPTYYCSTKRNSYETYHLIDKMIRLI
ncbi:DUF4371 domain-containing protein [Artemisia annua]|uniref:DUF4371 domain-containing protein n=1 Tax=Artemisia annua TaxID=35608 RepID=A0A2U1PRB1_ARTAN|nr:DUF4371 domain-containing protein [Artemisia annua]